MNGKETYLKKVFLSDSDMITACKEAATLRRQIESHRADGIRMLRDYRAELKRLNDEMNEVMNLIGRGYNEEEIVCSRVKDFQKRIVHLIGPDGSEIDTRPFELEDYQKEIGE